jgi:shikimate dehydrogenase
MLGSGGAARALAITIGIFAKPAELLILGAIEDELARLARDVAERTGCNVGADLLTDASLAAGLAKAQILLHCTPVGMKPDSERSLVPRDRLRSDLVVFRCRVQPAPDFAPARCRRGGVPRDRRDRDVPRSGRVAVRAVDGQAAPREIMRRVLDARL